jgi:HEAT repeat-containing protein 5
MVYGKLAQSSILILSHCIIQDDLKPHQSQLEESLLKVIISPEPFPPPGRPLRNTVARCLRTLYTKAETRSMYDTLQALLKIVADHKVVDKDVQKMYKLHL